MDIDTKQAQESLDAVKATMDRADRSIESAYANPMLILWGTVWVAAYTLSHFYLQYVATIMWTAAIIGGIGAFFIIKWYWSGAPVKSTSDNNLLKKVCWMWFFVLLYLLALMYILKPFGGMQMNAALMTSAMFAYIIMGLWFNSRFFIALGLTVTVTTLIGYALLKPYYCLWMAASVGLTLLLTGIYIRLKWR